MVIYKIRTTKPFISPNSKDNDQPRKVNLTPYEQQWNSPRTQCVHTQGFTELAWPSTESNEEEHDSSLQVTKKGCGLLTTQNQLTRPSPQEQHN